MANPYLVGNGRWCSCCFPDGRPRVVAGTMSHEVDPRPGCNECCGHGRIAFSDEQILARNLSARPSPYEFRAEAAAHG